MPDFVHIYIKLSKRETKRARPKIPSYPLNEKKKRKKYLNYNPFFFYRLKRNSRATLRSYSMGIDIQIYIWHRLHTHNILFIFFFIFFSLISHSNWNRYSIYAPRRMSLDSEKKKKKEGIKKLEHGICIFFLLFGNKNSWEEEK